jgi:hypothetical protein
MKNLLLLASCLAAAQDSPKEQLKVKLKDTDIVGNWIYDDIDAGFAEARKSGKPLLVAFR